MHSNFNKFWSLHPYIITIESDFVYILLKEIVFTFHIIKIILYKNVTERSSGRVRLSNAIRR